VYWLLQVMLGVDRLDMIKGIPQKLLAFEKFLHEHPEWRDKVLLVQVRRGGASQLWSCRWTWRHARSQQLLLLLLGYPIAAAPCACLVDACESAWAVRLPTL